MAVKHILAEFNKRKSSKMLAKYTKYVKCNTENALLVQNDNDCQ